jgi:hypothetical protein
VTQASWHARLAQLIPASVGEHLVTQLEMHEREQRSGVITLILDCDTHGVCREGRVQPAAIVGRRVTAP